MQQYLATRQSEKIATPICRQKPARKEGRSSGLELSAWETISTDTHPNFGVFGGRRGLNFQSLCRPSFPIESRWNDGLRGGFSISPVDDVVKGVVKHSSREASDAWSVDLASVLPCDDVCGRDL